MNAPAKRQPIPFGKYLLLDRINIGGMAEVWRGKMFGAGGFERLVAIKRILPNIAEDEEFIVMFLDEAKITVQLTHANIAQVYDLDKVQSSYYIAMEYVPGKDMRAIFDRCRKKGEPAPVPMTCFMVAKMCEGLDYAHRKKDQMGRDMNIVHRDISPQNVLISYEGEVKVIDFGIAKAAGKASKTQAGILKGKFAYMSPEQIRGLPLDRRSDVFAVGVCLYEMLTGERLFVGDSDFSVLEKVRKAEVLPPSTYNRRIPEPLEKIVLKALAKDVEDRYQYCSDLADDLQRFLITSDSIFSRKDLMQYMKSTFAEDVEREKLRLQEYAEIKPSAGMMAAIEMGLAGAPSAGAPSPLPLSQPAPQMAPPRLSASAIPVVGPPVGRQSQSLPPVAPPVLAQQPAPSHGGDATQVPRRAPSLTAVPKLTAAAPMLGNAHDEEGGATMLVDGREYFDDQPEPRTVPAGSPALTAQVPETFKADSSSTAVVGPPQSAQAQPVVPPGRAVTGSYASPVLSAPVPAPAAQNKRPSRSQPAIVGRAAPLTPPVDEEDVDEMTVPTSPSRKSMPDMEPTPDTLVPNRGGSKKWIGIMAAVALVAIAGAVGVVLTRGPAQGVLYVNVPAALYGKAHLNINGQDKGVMQKPFFEPTPSGVTAIMITADGYQPYAESVEVKPGTEMTRLDAKPVADQTFAALALAFQPEEAEVVINGTVVKKAGERAGPYLGELAVGKESVLEVRLAGHATWTQKVTPQSPTEPVKFTAQLPAQEHLLYVSSDPPGARIYVGQKDLGETPLKVAVPAGTSGVTLKKRCFDDATVDVALPEQPGSAPLSVSAKLVKQRGCR